MKWKAQAQGQCELVMGHNFKDCLDVVTLQANIVWVDAFVHPGVKI